MSVALLNRIHLLSVFGLSDIPIIANFGCVKVKFGGDERFSALSDMSYKEVMHCLV